MEETKIIYHVDDEETPYLMKLFIPSDKVILGDLKTALNRPNCKYFFKSMDDDFGVVKEEIAEDNAHLPCFNGRVVLWLVSNETSSHSDNQSSGDNHIDSIGERSAVIGDSRPPSFHGPPQLRHGSSSGPALGHMDRVGVGEDETCTETDSLYSADRVPPLRNFRDYRYGASRGRMYPGGVRSPPSYDNTSSSMMSSDLESTSFFDSEEESSRFSTNTSMSSKYDRQRKKQRRRRMPPISRASSFSSMTDSTMTLNVITVTLNMETVNFLGISIVGQSNKGGDGGIYVGSIMKGGAVAIDGRVEPGDMILEVNGVSFEDMSNDEAVRTLREQVQRPGAITLVVAKCWDPNPKGYFSIPRQEPVRPIDPRAWVLHTNAMIGSEQPVLNPTLPPPPPGALTGTMTSTTSSSVTSSLPESEQRKAELRLTITSDMVSVVRAMAQPESGLEIRDRMWLKITIPSAFIGSDLVDWLTQHVEGFADRRDARKYAASLLRCGYIRHTVNKVTFSEQCYYVFGDLSAAMSQMQLDDLDSVSEVGDRDTLAPLPPPNWGSSSGPFFSQQYAPPPPYRLPNGPPTGPPGLMPPLPQLPESAGASGGPTTYPGTSAAGADTVTTPANFSTFGQPPAGPSQQAARPQSPSVVSGSVVMENCACIQTTVKAVKSLWENKEKLQQLQAIQLQKHQQTAAVGTTAVTTGSPHTSTRLHLGKVSESRASDETASSSSSHRSGGVHRGAKGRSPSLGAPGSQSSQNGEAGTSSNQRPSPSSLTKVGEGQAVSEEHTNSSQSTENQPTPETTEGTSTGKALPGRDLDQLSEDLRASKQSFRMAMGNPSC